MDSIPHHAVNGKAPYIVYAWVDPRDNTSIFYVGITINLYERFKQHMRCDGTNPQKDRRIQEILAAGHLPIVRTIEQADTFEQALEREQYWISHLQGEGNELTNAQVQERPVKKPEPIPLPPTPWWKRIASGRRSKLDETRQLFELYWEERKPGQTFGDFFRDDLSDDMCADGWGYYPKHYISKEGKSHELYKQWHREWVRSRHTRNFSQERSN